MQVEGARPTKVALHTLDNKVRGQQAAKQPQVNNALESNAPRFAAIPPNLGKVYFAGSWLDAVKKSQDVNKSKALVEEIDFSAYWDRALQNPRIAATSVQRIYDMILDAGVEVKKIDGREVTAYNFFEKPGNPENALIGMEKVLDEFVQYLHQAAMGTKAGERLIMFVGGPGSAKSTLVNMIKKGLEDYTQTDKGQLYSLKWVNLPTDEESLSKIRNPKDREYFKKLGTEFEDPLRADPINVIPRELRGDLEREINEAAKEAGLDYSLRLKGELSPPSLWLRDRLLEIYDYDITKVVENHVKAKRIVISEDKRVGVGTFEARDSKGLDVTQLVGGVSYTRLADFDGDESHPLAYDFHTGELFIANRGGMEMIEALKLDQEFLYLLFSLAQERKVKADKMPLVSVDETVFAHSNGPDYQNMVDNPSLVALPSRMRIFKFPYPTDMASEERIYKKDYMPIAKERGIHVAPHALEVAALWATTTRLLEPDDGNLEFLVKKAKLYSGKEIKGYTTNDVRKFKAEAAEKDEGLTGVSPREMQTLLPITLTNREANKYKTVDGSLILKIIRERLDTGFFNISEDEKKKFSSLLDLAEKELDERYKEDVMEAIAGDVQRLQGILQNYLDNVRAYCTGTEIEDPHTFKSGPPDERLMSSIELKMGIDKSKQHDFRHGLMSSIGTLKQDGKDFNWDTNEELRKAIVAKVFEDQKDTINLSILTSPQAGARQKEDMDTIVKRLLDKGYNDVSARNAIARVRKLQNR